MNKKKLKKAVAIKYDLEDIAPKIIAKGKGYVAERIIEKAKQEDIPVYEDQKVVEKLFNLELQEYIPEDLYEVVAQILVFIGYLDKISKNGAK
ncbi:flagellar biosynthesis protein [Caldicellulosiruptor bescii]|jgi:flagellar biosynthesis protein|uniref:Flagellar protein FhlB-like protein n=2 Tax=Caldicellulosiruptor bescii TaxID=31899 RepID=B9MQX4_CALBD|nr:EscU/YscU/HrcU family type III secretion system export apparatus switch protein [Caldicellulosiruptor bescii]ACM60078.1 flagellar protein FhlB-like protein [Caldicellulosiruptor bescii DSM 6725]PBC87492.1 flagellar biosynthesis protein [Caldicellulosiruptor bescii]PBC90425.1 flagellar biosynthesis protein [Caldicellulosiruptor bescii]PBD04143.1 flagellar biosynthesis protein [Caldicellulosiruptor bescii]PBD06222.1 flagellar biosynthesis protein [Caldicellulosiruptor bescii]